MFEGRGFESQHHILDGYFSHLLVKIVMIFEKTKINQKEAGDGHFLKKYAFCPNVSWQLPVVRNVSFQKDSGLIKNSRKTFWGFTDFAEMIFV